LEIDIEVHEIERQCLVMCTRWLPTLNEIDLPAWAGDVSAAGASAISTARKQDRVIESLPQVMRKASRGEFRWM
jgi:hypothetical protein